MSSPVHAQSPDQAVVEADTRIAANASRLGDLEMEMSRWFSHTRTLKVARVTLDGRTVFERTRRK